jgi:hypothetical protein
MVDKIRTLSIGKLGANRLWETIIWDDSWEYLEKYFKFLLRKASALVTLQSLVQKISLH